MITVVTVNPMSQVRRVSATHVLAFALVAHAYIQGTRRELTPPRVIQPLWLVSVIIASDGTAFATNVVLRQISTLIGYFI